MRWAGFQIAGLLLVCLCARADDAAYSAERLRLMAAELIGQDAGRRAEVSHTLSHLPADARDAVAERLELLSATRPAAPEVVRILSSLRKIAGARPADLTLAVPELLARERSADVLAAVEPLLYLRSLETMPNAEGQLVLAAFVDLDAGAWEAELAQVRARLGVTFVPALITLRSHKSADVKRFAQAQLSALGMEDPRAVLANIDPQLVARAVRAYASPPDYAAMPAIVRVLGDRRVQVRDAARAAVHNFGRNAIWQVRELYEELSGQPADKTWDHEQTARELYAVLDRPLVEESHTLLASGQHLLATGDLAGMQREYDALLAKHPGFEERAQLAPGYAARAADLFRHDALEPSLAAWRRALRLAPDSPDAKRWQAQVAFVSAELSLTRGVVDLAGYTRALELDPQLKAARDAHDRLSGARAQEARALKRKLALGGVIALLVLVLLLMRRMAAAATPKTETEHGN
ncbi:MAG TPA: hypothetical protein VJV78_38340 [Polyangiales bacterium]|nr:hypothetical protein [Polyangiales bacterium]